MAEKSFEPKLVISQYCDVYARIHTGKEGTVWQPRGSRLCEKYTNFHVYSDVH